MTNNQILGGGAGNNPITASSVITATERSEKADFPAPTEFTECVICGDKQPHECFPFWPLSLDKRQPNCDKCLKSENRQHYYNKKRDIIETYGLPSYELNKPANKAANLIAEAQKEYQKTLTVSHKNTFRNDTDKFGSMTAKEQIAAKALINSGFKVYRGGWPDFLCIKSGSVTFIEVKSFGDQLRENQKDFHEVLRTLGFNVSIMKENNDGEWNLSV